MNYVNIYFFDCIIEFINDFIIKYLNVKQRRRNKFMGNTKYNSNEKLELYYSVDTLNKSIKFVVNPNKKVGKIFLIYLEMKKYYHIFI